MKFIEKLRHHDGVYPGYPELSERRPLSTTEYHDWANSGRPAGIVVGLYDHPNYLQGVRRGLAVVDDGTNDFGATEFAPSFQGKYLRDGNGRPVHPYAEDILVNGLGVEGPGACWQYGPNIAADPIVMGRSSDGKLKTIAISRADTGIVALPGGHLDAGEQAMIAAARELKEETGIELFVDDVLEAHCVFEGIVPDPRTTINAWLETSAYVFLLKDGVIDNFTPVGGDDAKEAFVATVDEELYYQMNPAHSDYVRKAVEWLEDEYELLVTSDGYVQIVQD